MNKKDDARVAKTKATLLANFKIMLAEKPFENITVNELCSMSGIRRATFYKHFYDKYDFLKYFIGTLRDDFDKEWDTRKQGITSSYYTQYIIRFIDFLIENEKFVDNALESDLLYTLVNIIKQQNYHDTCEKLRESVKNGMKLSASVEIVAAMMIGAVASAILYWFDCGRSTPKEQLTSEITAVIRSMCMYN